MRIRLALGAVTVLLATGCHGTSRDAAPAATASIATALAWLESADTAFTADLTVTGWNDWHSTGSGETAPDAMSLDMPGLPAPVHWLYGGKDTRVVVLGHQMYVGAGSLSADEASRVVGAGARWAAINLANDEVGATLIDMIAGEAALYTPPGLLRMMRASRDVHAVSSEGTVTRYDGTVTEDRVASLPEMRQGYFLFYLQMFFLAAQASDASFSVWSDPSGWISKITFTMSSGDGNLVLHEELSGGHGVTAPPAADVWQSPWR